MFLQGLTGWIIGVSNVTWYWPWSKIRQINSLIKCLKKYGHPCYYCHFLNKEQDKGIHFQVRTGENVSLQKEENLWNNCLQGQITSFKESLAIWLACLLMFLVICFKWMLQSIWIKTRRGKPISWQEYVSKWSCPRPKGETIPKFGTVFFCLSSSSQNSRQLWYPRSSELKLTRNKYSVVELWVYPQLLGEPCLLWDTRTKASLSSSSF